MLHHSYYIVSVNTELGILLLSTISGSIIKLDEIKYQSLFKDDFSIFTEYEMRVLKKLCFVTEKEERALINKNRYDAVYNKTNKNLGLTILTTSECNARCYYCYEKGILNQKMSFDVADKIIEYVSKNYKNYRLHISWFGGEPLLNYKIIDYISNRLNNLGISFFSTMISNSSLFDLISDEQFDIWNLKKVQITLDGVYNCYDNIKNYKSKDIHFIDIIRNAHRLISYGIAIHFRLNFNPEKVDDTLNIIEFLHKEFGNNSLIKIYPAWIVSMGIKSPADYESNRNPILKIYEKLIDYGYIKSFDYFGVKYRTVHCGAFKKYIVIAPDGALYKCEHVVKNSECKIGEIRIGISNDMSFNKWVNPNLIMEKCEQCLFLPSCEGGCKDMIFDGKEEYACVPIKYYIEDIIKICYSKGVR